VLRDATQRLNAQSRALVDHALDRVFAEPFAVTTPRDFERLMLDHRTGSGHESLESAAWVRSALPLVLARLLRVSRVGSRVAGKVPFLPAKVAKYAIAAIPIAMSLSTTARHGVHELQVLASFLAHRFRVAGIEPDPALVRALTLAIARDPDRRPLLEAGTGKAGAAVGGQWVLRSLGTSSTSAARERARAQLAAVERLDLVEIAREWDRRRGADDPFRPPAITE
jgi:hypothetical protein